ncbi:MAG: ABC transporter permease [Calditrichaeota bacterium]|nr:MAG: ABC transporter permease [Calditrichota bacterium]
MQRILYMVQKEFRQILRERSYIAILFVMPVVQIILLGFAITTDVKNITIGILDLDNTHVSRRVGESFHENVTFRLYAQTHSEKELHHWMDEGSISVGVVIPPHFEKDLVNAVQPDVQIILDGVDGNTAGVVAAYVAQLSAALQGELLQRAPALQREWTRVHSVAIEPRMWYNPSLESVNNIVPGIIATLITMVTVLVTAMSIVREKELGTLEQLMVTPLRKGELMLGKIIPFALSAFILVIVSIISAGLIFNIWMQGSLWTLLGMSVLFSISTLGVGILASTIASTQQQAMFVAWFFMIFALLLSGFFIPIENMPDVIQWITYLNPLRYFMVVIREIYLKGTSYIHLWRETLAMLLVGMVSFGLATIRFHKRVG